MPGPLLILRSATHVRARWPLLVTCAHSTSTAGRPDTGVGERSAACAANTHRAQQGLALAVVA
ncbi:hypothetical protein SAMN04490356_7825 [Streptomyces melanosporofaciens]|uniref:Uncharacterized protein n=1 Tax=Streptomyces melanosporofaciens TaxID=67327 RepID=A0A1H4ZH90_STRMJ|nr:hypothetical protein SAMN04490356_7825 [Streptomyces melanosporofaciens]